MTDEVKVTQADRDAAAYLCLNRLSFTHGGEQSWMNEAVQPMREGLHDDHPDIQRFARHRIQSTAAKDAQIAELQAALEKAIESLENAADDLVNADRFDEADYRRVQADEFRETLTKDTPNAQD